MPVIYYCYYESDGLSIKDATALENELSLKLLSHGLMDLYGLYIPHEKLFQSFAFGTNGKPYLKDHPEYHFNLTHCDGLAACAFHDAPVGLDAELPGYFAPILINKALTESEQVIFQAKGISEALQDEWFFRFWTLKEAYVKLSGVGLDTDLKAFSFSFNENPDEGQYSVSCSDPNVLCYQTQLSAGHIISLCTGKESQGAPVLRHIVF